MEDLPCLVRRGNLTPCEASSPHGPLHLFVASLCQLSAGHANVVLKTHANVAAVHSGRHASGKLKRSNAANRPGGVFPQNLLLPCHIEEIVWNATQKSEDHLEVQGLFEYALLSHHKDIVDPAEVVDLEFGLHTMLSHDLGVLYQHSKSVLKDKLRQYLSCLPVGESGVH